MTEIQEITSVVEKYFPLFLAESWDNPGLQIGNPQGAVKKALLALDISAEVVDQAIDQGCELILTHHPLFFKPVKSLREGRMPDDLIFRLIRAGISVYSAHTNLDSGEEGLNQYLGELLELQKIRPLNREYTEKGLKMEAYLTISEAERFKSVLETRFARHLNDLDVRFTELSAQEMLFSVSGSDAEISRMQAFLNNTLQREAACTKYVLDTPAKTWSLGRVGELPQTLSLKEFALKVKEILGLNHILVTGDPERPIKKVGIVTGSGVSFMTDAVQKKCDVLLTGDLKYHEAQDAGNLGIAIVDAGHQGSEQIVKSLYKNILEKEKTAHGWSVTFIEAGQSELIYSL